MKTIEPDYYKHNGIEADQIIGEVLEFVELPYHASFHMGCVIKYLLRFKNKGGIEDLTKAQTYIEKLKQDLY